MSEIRQLVAYGDIVIGEDFNSRESFRAFSQKAFDVADDGKCTLKSSVALKKVLSVDEMGMLDRLKELAASIEEHGLLQPLIVREGGPSKKGKRRSYFLMAGERRFRAIGLIKEKTNKFRQVEIKLKKCNADTSMLVNLLENLQREDLEPLEVARGIEKIMEVGKLTQAQAAKKISRSEPYVSQHLALLRVAPELQAAVAAGTITATHVREMSTLPPAKQKEILQTVTEKMAKGEKVSVQAVKDEAEKHKKALGLKKTRGRKGNDVEYDMEKIAAAKEVLGDCEITMRSKRAAFEQYGILVARLHNPQTSDATKAVTKIQISCSEYYMGVRDKL